MAYTKIDYFMRPQGLLKNIMEKAIKELNSELDMAEKIRRGKETIVKLMQIEQTRYAESMYKSKQFIAEKHRFEVSGVQDYLNKTFNTAKEERTKHDFVGACLTMMCGFYGLMFYYNIPQTTHEHITDGLQESGSKEWEVASQLLWNTLEKIMNQSTRTNNSYGLREV